MGGRRRHVVGLRSESDVEEVEVEVVRSQLRAVVATAAIASCIL